EQPPTDKKHNPRSQEIDDIEKVIVWNRGKVKRQILRHVEGLSPVFIDKIEHRAGLLTQHNILATMKEVMKDTEDIVPVFHDLKRPVFYHTPLTHLGEADNTFENLSELLDDFYHKRAHQSMIKQKANDYYQVIEREHAKTLRKIDKLKEDLSEAK